MPPAHRDLDNAIAVPSSTHVVRSATSARSRIFQQNPPVPGRSAKRGGFSEAGSAVARPVGLSCARIATARKLIAILRHPDGRNTMEVVWPARQSLSWSDPNYRSGHPDGAPPSPMSRLAFPVGQESCLAPCFRRSAFVNGAESPQRLSCRRRPGPSNNLSSGSDIPRRQLVHGSRRIQRLDQFSCALAHRHSRPAGNQHSIRAGTSQS